MNVDKQQRTTLSNAKILSFIYRADWLKPMERHVACAILSGRNQNNFRCNPLRKTIQRKEQLPESKLKRIMAALKQHKIMVGVQPPPTKLNNGKWRFHASWYFFEYDLAEAITLAEAWQDSPYKGFMIKLMDKAKDSFEPREEPLHSNDLEPKKVALCST